MQNFAKLFTGCLLIGLLIACTYNPSPKLIDKTPIPTTPPPLPTAVKPQGETIATQKTVIAKPQMNTSRAAHTATWLGDGTVLFTGGLTHGEEATNSAEIFDPETRLFSSTNPMSVARQSHTATLLPDGKLLLAGGFNGDYLASAELYDPVTGLFTPTGSMTMGRSGHTAVLLNNGKVLLTGGVGIGWTFLASSELYDPVTGSFTATGDMTTPRESHTATRLTNGKVLIVGGHQGRRAAITIFDSAELYDPYSGTFSETGKMTVKRHKHDATGLADGRVFISGGADERDAQGAYQSTEIFDPETGNFTVSAPMHHTRYKHTGTSLLLPSGEVFLVGGASAAEIYDPRTDTMREVAAGVDTARFFASATLLSNGEILFAGGYGRDIAADKQAWVLR